MQTGACDADLTSSTSLISFRLEEVAKSLTTGRGKFLLVHARAADHLEAGVRPSCSKPEQDAIMQLGQEMEEFGLKEAQADDQKVADVYSKKGLAGR